MEFHEIWAKSKLWCGHLGIQYGGEDFDGILIGWSQKPRKNWYAMVVNIYIVEMHQIK